MAAPKGHPRYGGRAKGTPNKVTQELMKVCEEEGIDPFRALLKIAKGENIFSDTDQKLAALKEICQYLYPKRKSMEHSGEVTNPYMDMPYEELKNFVIKKLKDE